MTVNTFEDDDKWQRAQRDKYLSGFYGRYAREGRYVYIDKGRLASTLQKRFAVDTIIQAKNGSAICIEEKIVRWKGRSYSAFALETHSCTVPGYESDGWMKYGEADYLLYCFQPEQKNGLNCYLIRFPELKKWFWPLERRFPTFGPLLDTPNRTKGRVASIALVRANVPTWWFRVPDGR